MKPVRIGCVKYLNTAPLVEGLERWADVELIPAAPARLIDLLAPAAGEPRIDIGLVSLIDAVRSPAPLTLLPVGMIGCDGPTLTVRVFSAVPIGAIRTLHADTDSHTSVELARVVLRGLHGIDVKVVDFDARERVALGASGGGEHGDRSGEWPASVLMIGDKVVTDSPPAVRYPYQLDLGEAWKAMTGLPFMYATWMCRSGDLDGPRGDELCAAALALDRQRRHNQTRLAWLAAARSGGAGRWPTDLAQRYLGALLRYEVGQREREAAERFLTLASGASGIAGRVNWMELDEILKRAGATPTGEARTPAHERAGA